MKRRIWELDVARGACLLLMFYCHIVYDLVFLFRIVPTVNDGGLFQFTTNYTGILFIALSGISATLGKHPIKRGLTVFDKGIMIYFGILHCIGLCMLIWPAFRKLPWWVLIPVGLAVICMKDLVQGIYADTYLLLPFGVYPRYFVTSDYFPLVPCFGYFLIGSGFGRLLYKKKESRLPELRFFPFNALGFMGRHSLLIYLAHQPILTGFIFVISLFV